MDIKKLTDIELKALGYDAMAQIEASQNNLKAIASELQSRNVPFNAEPAETPETNEPVATSIDEQPVGQA